MKRYRNGGKDNRLSPGDGYFKYVAVVNEAESIQTVQANIEHLNSVFLGE